MTFDNPRAVMRNADQTKYYMHSISMLLIAFLFIFIPLTIIITTSGEFFYFELMLLLASPFLIGIISFLIRILMMLRNSNELLFERVKLENISATNRRLASFNVSVMTMEGRIIKKTAPLFSVSNYAKLSLNKYNNKEVIVAHHSTQKHVYLVGIIREEW